MHDVLLGTHYWPTEPPDEVVTMNVSGGSLNHVLWAKILE